MTRHALWLKLGAFVVPIGSIKCPNDTFQLTAVRENEESKLRGFFKKEKTGFSFLKKNPIFKVFVLTNGCELEGAIWAFDRSNWYYKTTKFEPQRMPCQGKPLKNFIFLSVILLRKNGGAFQLGTI